MSRYYLMAQLPSLDGISESTPLPVTQERFDELCRRFLGEKTVNLLDDLTLVPPKDAEVSGSSFVDAWNSNERSLRLALAVTRAEKMKKPFGAETQVFPVQILQAAHNAVDMEDPLAAEQFLLKFRLDFLETLRPMDAFSEDAVLYYGLKLKLLSRIRQFDKQKGLDAYKNIYDSIMRGNGQEATEK